MDMGGEGGGGDYMGDSPAPEISLADAVKLAPEYNLSILIQVGVLYCVLCVLCVVGGWHK